jgi:hypothetical protein
MSLPWTFVACPRRSQARYRGAPLPSGAHLLADLDELEPPEIYFRYTDDVKRILDEQ